MKHLAILAVFALVGCKQALPPTQVINSTGDGNTNISVAGPDQSGFEPGHVMPTKKLQYIADNHCEPYWRDKSTPILQADGTIDNSNGWTEYRCPNGVRVIIYDRESK